MPKPVGIDVERGARRVEAHRRFPQSGQPSFRFCAEFRIFPDEARGCILQHSKKQLGLWPTLGPAVNDVVELN